MFRNNSSHRNCEIQKRQGFPESIIKKDGMEDQDLLNYCIRGGQDRDENKTCSKYASYLLQQICKVFILFYNCLTVLLLTGLSQRFSIF